MNFNILVNLTQSLLALVNKQTNNKKKTHQSKTKNPTKQKQNKKPPQIQMHEGVTELHL